MGIKHTRQIQTIQSMLFKREQRSYTVFQHKIRDKKWYWQSHKQIKLLWTWWIFWFNFNHSIPNLKLKRHEQCFIYLLLLLIFEFMNNDKSYDMSRHSSFIFKQTGILLYYAFTKSLHLRQKEGTKLCSQCYPILKIPIHN